MIVVRAADADGSASRAGLAAFARHARRAVVVAKLERELTMRLGAVDTTGIERVLERAERAAAATMKAVAGAGLEVELHVATDDDLSVLSNLVASLALDVVLVDDGDAYSRLDSTSWAAELTRVIGRPVALLRGSRPAASPTSLLCPFDGDVASVATVAALLGACCDSTVSVTLGALGDVDAGLEARVSALGAALELRAALRLEPLEIPLLGAEATVDQVLSRFDAIVVPSEGPRGVTGLLAARRMRRIIERADAPIIVAPRVDRPEHASALEVSDAMVMNARAIVRLEERGAFGRARGFVAEDVGLVLGDRAPKRVPVRESVVVVEGALTAAQSVGVGRSDPVLDSGVETIEAAAALVRPSDKRWLLADASLPPSVITAALAAIGGELSLALVRLVEEDSLGDLRRLDFGSPAFVLDARDVLEEGDVSDLPREVDGVRLWRCAARLRAYGFRVEAILPARRGRLRPLGFAILDVDALDGSAAAVAQSHVAPAPLDAAADGRAMFAQRLTHASGARLVGGNALELHVDNRAAREAALELVASAAERLYIQSYIFEDDAIGQVFERAVRGAAARGVAVKILADSLYSLHESMGFTNPLLERLSNVDNVEVLAVAKLPSVPTVPSVEDLKRRDHRKLIVADGRVAIVSGRNVGATYYSSFEEVVLTRRSPWHDVPWIDASIRVAGPAASAIEQAFVRTWNDTAEPPIARLVARDAAPAAPVGSFEVRIVEHEGLGDACTLEAYLACFAAAERTIDLVHGFPLQLEIVAALMRAIARGVRVRVLVGRVRPMFAVEVPFEGGTIRDLADAFVRGRLDALFAAGAEGYEVALSPLPNWEPELVSVHPPVHAKLVVVDDRITAVGSANLDATGSYWESEVLVVVDDARFGREAANAIAALLGRSRRIDREAADWASSRSVNTFLSRHWPSLIG
ncbi:MAG: phosphatidylserine/phosphatidylglycerophosphate/cardiolipin synthase family protein [Polyangiaceae bacterium]